MWLMGALNVVFPPGIAATTAWVHQSRQMTLPLPGKIPWKRNQSSTYTLHVSQGRTINCGRSGDQHRGNEDVASNEPLCVNIEKLRLVGELVEQGPHGRETISGCISEKSVLPSNAFDFSILEQIITSDAPSMATTNIWRQ